MTIKTVAITIIILGLSTFASANNVYSPEKGIICDKKSGFCADSYGISLGLTKDYLGAKKAAKFEKILSDRDFDASAYTMSNGLSCDSHRKICKKSKWAEKADPHWTMVLFNRKVGGNHHGHGGRGLMQAARDCKMYLVNKFDLPMAAFSVSKGHPHKGKIFVPVSIQWNEPLVDERGECKVVNGVVKSYKARR